MLTASEKECRASQETLLSASELALYTAVPPVKIILSRKGFDSSVGGSASPILPDGRMLSLPIPTTVDVLAYADIRAPDGETFADVIGQLLGKHCPALSKQAHLDPDLLAGARPRVPGWRAALGQIGAAAGHLKNQQIGPGDLFPFYGWFRPTERVSGDARFCTENSGFHAIFGYLEVEQVISAPTRHDLPPWLRDHPHALSARLAKRTNTFYLSRDTFSGNRSVPGWGTFRFSERLVLSHPLMSRSRWRLDPDLFQHLKISYHAADAWREGYFQSYPPSARVCDIGRRGGETMGASADHGLTTVDLVGAPVGEYNSSLTRVAPIFDRLFARMRNSGFSRFPQTRSEASHNTINACFAASSYSAGRTRVRRTGAPGSAALSR
jgi:Nucleotide modification associated domain 3